MENSKETTDRFVQIRLWDDCINNCEFCSLQNRCRKTPLKSKKVRLSKTTELVETLNSKQIGLIGGEFFEGQLKGCENEWMDLLHALLETEAQLPITANLIHKQHFLQETIDLLGKRLMLCTSYDEVGRFHTEAARANWLKNVEDLHNQGVHLFCTCIQTQEFLEATSPLPEWLGVNLCDPHLGVDWYINVDKANYHKHLVEENSLFHLPKRSTAIRWMRQNVDLTRCYVAYNDTHSSTIYSFDDNDCLEKEFENRLTAESYVNPECGHPYFCQCYADSGKCMMCDATRILDEASKAEMMSKNHSKVKNIKMFK